ncbi:QueT transporter family protein [Wukongibacter baidiensis]|uniref:QueT transporter family protein n=1 Tax=Wukongibacter baidiensis TaxID=1723361 RepID=UPI003D7F2121
MRKFSTNKLVKTALIAAIYAAITMALAPISFGEIQFRLSEVLVLLAFIDPFYIPGLVLGCVIANFGSPLGPIDVLAGSFATLLSVSAIYQTRKLLGDNLKALIVASLWPVAFNGLIVGWMLNYVLQLPFWASAAYVALGEFVVVSFIGVVLFKAVLDRKNFVNILRLSAEKK